MTTHTRLCRCRDVSTLRYREVRLLQCRTHSIARWEYWARLAANEGLYYIPTTLATFRLQGRSATASNVNNERFRVLVLDLVILQYELIHNAHYAPVRVAARNAVPRIDLARGLLEYYQLAKSTFAPRSSQPAQTAHAIAYEWQRVQALYPKLRFFSVGYFPARVWRRVSRLFRSARRGLTFNGSMPWEPQLY